MDYDPTWGYPAPEPLEQRQEGLRYTDAAVSAALAAVSGGQSGDVTAIGAAEICAGLWGRAFASADIEGASPGVQAAITPEVLQIIGRSLVLRGEAAFEIRFSSGRLRLEPAAWWDIQGAPNPSTWRYRLTAEGPDRSTHRHVTGSRVVHARYAQKAAAPWQGLSPLAIQAETAGLAGTIERRLRQEAGGPLGTLISLPDTADTSSFEANLPNLNGKVLIVPTTAGGWSEGPDSQPRRDWLPQRLGAEPPDAIIQLRDRSAHHVLAACGVPTELIERADGTGLREAWRQFLFGTLAPVGKLVRDELREKLDSPALEFGWRELRASDLAGRARAFQSMVGSGMETDRAASLAGLLQT